MPFGKPKTVLALETSCDETAAAVCVLEKGSVRALSSVVSSQIDIHRLTGGVVPEVAARAHADAIGYIVAEALKEAFGDEAKAMRKLDAVAATTAPGLRPALIAGEAAGRALALGAGKPFIGVNHVAGHVAAAWLAESGERAMRPLPALVLIVSGGHTELRLLSKKMAFEKLGETADDAAGEAFDKIARILGLPYPGGPELEKMAEGGNAKAYAFPRPMLGSGDLNFSFSGLKTAVLYALKGKDLTDGEKRDAAASAQAAIAEVLSAKTTAALSKTKVRAVILAGGVAANKAVRRAVAEAAGEIPFIVPATKYCTDNAAMIGAAALLRIK